MADFNSTLELPATIQNVGDRMKAVGLSDVDNLVIAAAIRDLVETRGLLIVWDSDSAVSKSLAFAGIKYKNPLTLWTRSTGFQNTESRHV